MGRRPPVYGLDIETDAREVGLDPTRSSIVRVALSQEGLEELFTGFEPDLLLELDLRLAELRPGVLATWNGSTFDLPFLAARARRWQLPLGLVVQRNRPGPVPARRGVAPFGHRAAWYHHAHVDACPVLGGAGLAPKDALRAEAERANPVADAHLARVLVERHWARAARAIDRLNLGGAADSSAAG